MLEETRLAEPRSNDDARRRLRAKFPEDVFAVGATPRAVDVLEHLRAKRACVVPGGRERASRVRRRVHPVVDFPPRIWRRRACRAIFLASCSRSAPRSPDSSARRRDNRDLARASDSFSFPAPSRKSPPSDGGSASSPTRAPSSIERTPLLSAAASVDPLSGTARTGLDDALNRPGGAGSARRRRQVRLPAPDADQAHEERPRFPARPRV